MIFKTRYYYQFSACFLILTSSVGFTANPIQHIGQSLASSWVATINVGPAWESAGKTQTFFLAPNIENTYAANHKSHALIDGEAFLGIQKPLREKLEGQFGLAVATTGNAALSGNIWNDADSTFNNFTYRYQVKHTHLAIKGKLLADRDYVVIPWIGGSLGVGFNKAHNFTNTPTISEAVVMPNFTNNTTTALTYTLGAGIQRNLNSHTQVGIGYEFADWGQSQLGRASGQTVNTGLALSHLYTNGFLINFTCHA
jgi:opacity protein-like surface antigen